MAVFAALALAWLAMTLLFQRHLELRVEQELRRDALQLVAGVSLNPAGMITIQQLPTDPRFGIPAGGLYWQISTSQQSQRSRSLWARCLILGGGRWEGWRNGAWRTVRSSDCSSCAAVSRRIQGEESWSDPLEETNQAGAAGFSLPGKFDCWGRFGGRAWIKLTAAAQLS